MIVRTIQHAWRSHGRQFVKYLIIGSTSVAVDLGTLIVIHALLPISATIAVALNQLIVIAFSFTLNKLWTFRNSQLPHAQLVRYMLLWGWNYLFAVATMYVFAEQFGQDFRLVRIATIAVSVLWNFYLYKYWVFKNTEKSLNRAE